MTKRFIEDEARDVDGYKALEASFNHQHRGQKAHSRFMRPMCQTVHQSQDAEKPPETPVVIIHEADGFLETPERVNSSPETFVSSAGQSRPDDQAQSSGGSELRTPTTARQSRSRRNDTTTQQQGQRNAPRRQPSRRKSRSSSKFNLSGGGLCNIYFFMPYLQ